MRKNNKIFLLLLVSLSLAISSYAEQLEGKTKWPIFLVTNESNRKHTCQVIAELPVTMPRAAVIGVSIMQLLNLAAHRGLNCSNSNSIEYIIAVDTSAYTERFWLDVIPIIKDAFSKEEIIAQIEQLIREYPERYFPPAASFRTPVEEVIQRNCRRLKIELEEETSWLSKDDTTLCIQNIFREERFLLIPTDLGNKAAVENLAFTLKQNGIALDTLYISNLHQYAENIALSVSILAEQKSPGTLVVEAPKCKDQIVYYVMKNSLKKGPTLLSKKGYSLK